jgi:TonB-dependent starch-binding outer membrane protein SusC
MEKLKLMSHGDSFYPHVLKIKRIMRLTIIISLIGIYQAIAISTYSQSAKLSLAMDNARLKDVLATIEEQSEFYFLYSSKLVDVERSVSLRTTNSKIEEVLHAVFNGTETEYLVMDRQIILSPKNLMNETINIIAMQQNSVSGMVTDKSGAPLPGVTVVVKGTTIGTITGSDGRYLISNIPPGAALVFSFVGMRTQEIIVGNLTVVNISMEEDAIGIEEVVAIGYGTQKKSEVTSSISQIRGEDINSSTASNVVMALQGRASGIQMIASGEPGKTPSIRIRGVGTINNSEPLIVVDGVPVGAAVLSHLSPNEIQSVEILKDAASGAIYGTRAANGVLLITTNRARYNQPTTVQLNASLGTNSVIKKYPITTGEQLYELKRERYINDGLPIPANVPWSDPYYNATRTNWQDEFFQNGLFQDYTIKVSGGTERSTYNTTLFHRNEEGTQINTYFKRIGVSLNATHKITSRFRIEESIRVSKTHDLLTNEGSGTSVTLYSAYKFHPSIPLKYEDGNWGSGKAHTELGDMWNPIYKAMEEEQHNYRLNTFLNFRADYDIADNLTLTGRAAYEQNNAKYEFFQNVTPLQSRSVTNPTLIQNVSEMTSMLGEVFLNYTKKTGNHQIAAIIGVSAQEEKGEFLNMQGEVFASVAKNQQVMNNAGIITGRGNDFPSTSLASGFVRGNYNFADKYYLSSIFRADGSSRFADGNRWGYFPSVSAGWRISGEQFMKDMDKISNMKLNIGWGQLGNQNVIPFQYLNTYLKDQRYVFAGNKLTGTRLASFANPDITWETTSTLNILLELGLFQNALNLNVAYFDRMTKNMLIPSVAQGTAGLVRIPDSNIGEMNNKGFEIEPTYNGNIGNLNYSLGVNATFVKNEVTKLYGEGKFIGGGVTWGGLPISRTFEGDAISSFYGWKIDGVYQTQAEVDSDPNISKDPRKPTITPGDIRFVDINGDNIIDNQDRVKIGDPNPKMLMGITLDLSYKGLTFSAVFNGAYGHDVYNAMMMRGIDPTQSANMDAVAYERWTGPGTSDKWPKMSTKRVNENYRASELGIQSGNFTRLKDAVLGYNIPDSYASKIGVGKLRLYVTGRNLLTFTKYYGVDPEESGTNNLERGIIQNNYPQSRSVVFGVDITF